MFGFLSSLLLLLGLELDGRDGGPLLGDSVGAALAHGLVAQTAGLHLVGNVLGAGLLGLGLVNELHEDALVLEDVTLGLHVELVVEVLVNLAGLTVLPQQTPENTLAPHPHNLGWHTGLVGTLSLTGARVATGTLGSVQLACACSRVADGRLADNLAILDKLADVGAGVCVGNVVLLGGVEPDLALADAEDGRSKALLGAKVDHV